MLRRQIMTSINSHTAFQELTIYKDVDTKLCNVHLTTLDTTIEDEIKNSNIKFIKKSHAQT